MVDPLFMVKRSTGRLIGAIIIQVDDSYVLGKPEFLKTEECASPNFRYNLRIYLTSKPSHFNGLCNRRKGNGSILVEQREKIDKLRPAADQK